MTEEAPKEDRIQVYPIRRATELRVAAAVCERIDALVDEAKAENDKLAASLAEDNGLSYDPEVDLARFTYDEGGITLRIFSPRLDSDTEDA